MQIFLIHLINSFNLGGSTTYLIHLHEQFKLSGYDPIVLKVGKRKRTDYYYHVPVHYITEGEIIHIAKNNRCLITYCFWKDNATLCKKLISLGVPLVMHDPAEFHEEWLKIARSVNNTIVIREKNRKNLEELGVQSTFIQHPYVRGAQKQPKSKFAINFTRVDFRKHTEIVCEYNEQHVQKIEIYGEVNRMMDFHKLQKKHPAWKENYHGKIPEVFGEQVKLVSQYEYAIDLTAIASDGGGTQYCFLESWDAGSYLILNKQWDTGQDSILKDGVNCLFVADANELAMVLNEKRKYDLRGVSAMLDYHHFEKVIPQYTKICG